jgi:ribonuclease VapC
VAVEYVLDTFAILAMLRAEPGAERVRAVLDEARHGLATCRSSAINLGEVIYIVERRAAATGVRQLLATLKRLPLEIADATWERILDAALVKAHHRVSFADAFAIALAQEYGATILTGDPEFKAVAGQITIEWLAAT